MKVAREIIRLPLTRFETMMFLLIGLLYSYDMPELCYLAIINSYK